MCNDPRCLARLDCMMDLAKMLIQRVEREQALQLKIADIRTMAREALNYDNDAKGWQLEVIAKTCDEF